MENQKKTVRIVAMSDTHDTYHKIKIEELPKGDIFIHAGDFTKFSLKGQLQNFRAFLKLIPYKHKIVIAGNHDFVLDRQHYDSHFKKTKHKNTPMNCEEEIQKLKQCCTYLDHEFVQVQGVRIFGSPKTPAFFDWGFMYAPQQGEKVWSTIPQNIDVLITHGPPYGILDKTIRNEDAGCKGLLTFVKKLKPQIHIFGHIHESYGHVKIGQTTYYNASNVDITYRLKNPPFVIDVQVRKKPQIQQQQKQQFD